MPKKNKNANQQAQSSKQLQKERSRNTAILIAAILFFLLGLWMLARAADTDLFDNDGSGRGLFIIRNQTTRPAGGSAGSGGPGGMGAGTGGGNNNGGNNGGNGQNGLLEDLDVNVQTDSGIELDAGINQGQLYVDPQINPNPQGGVGAEVNINDQNVIDTGNLLGR